LQYRSFWLSDAYRNTKLTIRIQQYSHYPLSLSDTRNYTVTCDKVYTAASVQCRLCTLYTCDTCNNIMFLTIYDNIFLINKLKYRQLEQIRIWFQTEFDLKLNM